MEGKWTQNLDALGKYSLGNAKNKGARGVGWSGVGWNDDDDTCFFLLLNFCWSLRTQKCNCILPKQSLDFVFAGEGEGSGKVGGVPTMAFVTHTSVPASAIGHQGDPNACHSEFICRGESYPRDKDCRVCQLQLASESYLGNFLL